MLTKLHNTADLATKLFAATEDLKSRTDTRRMLPGGPASKKAPYLLSQADSLDKQRALLRAEIGRIEEYRISNPKVWGEDMEDLLLEVQISEHSITQSLIELRLRLEPKHRWYLLGH